MRRRPVEINLLVFTENLLDNTEGYSDPRPRVVVVVVVEGGEGARHLKNDSRRVVLPRPASPTTIRLNDSRPGSRDVLTPHGTRRGQRCQSDRRKPPFLLRRACGTASGQCGGLAAAREPSRGVNGRRGAPRKTKQTGGKWRQVGGAPRLDAAAMVGVALRGGEGGDPDCAVRRRLERPVLGPDHAVRHEVVLLGNKARAPARVLIVHDEGGGAHAALVPLGGLEVPPAVRAGLGHEG